MLAEYLSRQDIPSTKDDFFVNLHSIGILVCPMTELDPSSNNPVVFSLGNNTMYMGFEKYTKVGPSRDWVVESLKTRGDVSARKDKAGWID
jgi:hypothetical protein